MFVIAIIRNPPTHMSPSLYMYDEIEDSFADKMIQNFFDEKFAFYTLDNFPSYQFYTMS